MTMQILREKCARLRELMNQKEVVEETLKTLNKEIETLTRIELPEMAEALDVKNVTFEGVGRLQFASDLFCSTREGQKDEAMQWLRDCGYTDMISETYNASSMKALVRRLIVDGTEVPEFLNVTPFTRATLVRVKS